MAEKALGTPTKGFFVDMLTRDIELNDAILDLLDNCLDGVVRQKGRFIDKHSTPDYYSGYYSYITIDENSFIIEDNCGGIPRDVAEKYAFRMGRSSDKTDDDLPTVGIYGIGMKRAIFKIGKAAKVTARNKRALYQVVIPEDWATKDEWDFPINELDNPEMLQNGGTKIEITAINDSIAQVWNTDDKMQHFVSMLIKSIQQCYSFIIKKGFEIRINNEIVKPLPLEILFDQSAASGIQPFLYKQEFDNVKVNLVVGFYAPPPSPDEIDEESTMKRSSADAGWTVICNDRVVLYNDKSHLTGWGEAGVPQYHTQFIGIRGIVVFESNSPQDLPMTTTKRGIDTSSSVYAAVKDRMRQGLKIFTDYTNRWKGQNTLERKHSGNANSISIDALLGDSGDIEATSQVKFQPSKGGRIFTPSLPKPPNDRPYRRISFNRDLKDILDIVEYLYRDRDHSITPSQVGEKCFDLTLKQAHESEEGEKHGESALLPSPAQ